MTEVGNVYGEALYDLAQAEGLSDSVLEQLTALEESVAQAPEFLRLLTAPNLSKQERCGIVNSSFETLLHPYVLNFLKLLTEKGYARHFPDCCVAFRARYYQEHNILPVTAVTALALTPAQSEKLRDKLSALTGKQITLTNRVDPDILGGVRLDYDGKQLDDTLAHHLDTIRTKLSSTVL